MIHTEERPRTRQPAAAGSGAGAARGRARVPRARRPPRHPADDLRAIGPPPSPGSPQAGAPEAGGPFKCEMCSLEFPRRDDLLLHVPVHI